MSLEEEIQKRSEDINNDIHTQLDEMFNHATKKNLSYQDVMNILLIRRIAMLELQIEDLFKKK